MPEDPPVPDIPIPLATETTQIAVLAALAAILEKLTEIALHQQQLLDYEDRKLWALTHGAGLRRNSEYPGPGWE